MKSTLIRTFAILMLASSVSAFAAGNNPCSGTETKNTSSQDQASKKEKKARDQKNNNQQEKSDQEKEFERVLMGIYG